MEDIQLLDDRILVRRDSTENKTEGGLFIPDAAKTPVNRGTVLAIGTGRQLESGSVVPMKTKVGDRIIFYNGGVTELGIETDPDIILMSERTVYAVIGNVVIKNNENEVSAS